MLKAAVLERRGPVGWVVIKDVEALMEQGWEVDEFAEIHTAVALALEELRFDRSIRIVGLTGERDGEFYSLPRRVRFDEEQRHRDRHNPLRRGSIPELNPRGPGRGHASPIETLLLMEKPVLARVNGDAIGFGQSLLWGCDIIVALEEAVVSDVHLGQGDVVDGSGEARGFPYGITPGDGAMAFWPLFLPPTKAKEYQLLSRAWTAKELAGLNVVNYAVPTYEALDAKVDELVAALLARPQQVLVQTKRVAQKRVIEHWNLAQDLASAYERLDFWVHAHAGHMDPGWSPEPVERLEGGWSPKTG